MRQGNAVTEEQIPGLLKAAKGKGSWTELAKRIGVHKTFLCHVLHGIKTPGPKILKFLGLKYVLIQK